MFDYGRTLDCRWIELFEPQEDETNVNDTMTCDEIVDGIWDRMVKGRSKDAVI